jgi:hypothetical protein
LHTASSSQQTAYSCLFFRPEAKHWSDTPSAPRICSTCCFGRGPGEGAATARGVDGDHVLPFVLLRSTECGVRVLRRRRFRVEARRLVGEDGEGPEPLQQHP